MDNQMFCFQREQTADCNTAELQDKLAGALIGLARATEGNCALVTEATDRLAVEGFFATITNVNFNNDNIIKNKKLHTNEKTAVGEIPSAVWVFGRF